MSLRKSHIGGGIAEYQVAALWEGTRLAYFQSLDSGSGYYSELIADIEARRNFYWMRIQEACQ